MHVKTNFTLLLFESPFKSNRRRPLPLNFPVYQFGLNHFFDTLPSRLVVRQFGLSPKNQNVPLSIQFWHDVVYLRSLIRLLYNCTIHSHPIAGTSTYIKAAGRVFFPLGGDISKLCRLSSREFIIIRTQKEQLDTINALLSHTQAEKSEVNTNPFSSSLMLWLYTRHREEPITASGGKQHRMTGGQAQSTGYHPELPVCPSYFNKLQEFQHKSITSGDSHGRMLLGRILLQIARLLSHKTIAYGSSFRVLYFKGCQIYVWHLVYPYGFITPSIFTHYAKSI